MQRSDILTRKKLIDFLQLFGITSTGKVTKLKITDQAAVAMGNILLRKF